MVSPTPFIEITIQLLKDLNKRGLSYEEAIKELEELIEMIEKSLKENKRDSY